MRTLLPPRSLIHYAASAGLSASEAKALGALPEWNLNDLYPSPDSAELKSDFEWVETEANKFAADYRGKLDALLKGSRPSAALHEAIKRYEAIDDKLGRILSYAGLVYSGDTTDPVRANFIATRRIARRRLAPNFCFLRLSSIASMMPLSIKPPHKRHSLTMRRGLKIFALKSLISLMTSSSKSFSKNQ